eukprot:TRINITY_DN12732_c0_g1_i1.p1 TRINITY_DN12732_c0_g1~~TRINITY_DN12732_c0_g1_i1.p1  ORF type:complete len:104 (+),score=19.34 TRINITY_DN12732_c0_g1_i1:3-314(+)
MKVLEQVKSNKSLWINLKEPMIEFKEASFLEYEWWLEADVVYTCDLCFDDDLQEKLTNFLEKMKKGSRVICLCRKNRPYLKLLYTSQHKFTWGFTVMYIYVKV